MVGRRPGVIDHAPPARLLDVPAHGVLDLLGSAVVHRPVGDLEVPSSQHLEDLAGAGEIGHRLADVTAQRFEPARHIGERRTDRRLDRQTEVGRPGHAQPVDVEFGELGEDRTGLGQRDRHPRVGPGDHLHLQRQVVDRASHGTRRRHPRPRRAVGPVRHTTDRRAQPDDVAERGRVAQRATHVGPVGDRDHAGRQSDRCSPTGTATRPGDVVGVVRRTEHLVERLRTGTELGRVGLADRDHTGGTQTLHDQCVLRRYEVSQQW